MAIKLNSGEGGTDGVVASTANTGGLSGDVFNQVTSGMTFSAARAFKGSLGYQGAKSATQYCAWNVTDTIAIQRSYVTPEVIADGQTLMRMSLATSTNSLLLLNSGRVQLFKGVGLGTAPVGTEMVVGTVYRVELGTDVTNNLSRGAFYLGDSTTPIWDSGWITPAAAIAALSMAQYGNAGSTAGGNFDAAGLKTGVDAVWAPWPAVNMPPTLSLAVGNPNPGPSAAAGLTITTTDPEGGAVTVLTTVMRYRPDADPASVAVTNSTATNPTWTTHSAASLDIATVTATDNSSGVTTATAEVYVSLTNGTPVTALRKNAENKVGTWTEVGSATTDGGALIKPSTNDSNYLESGMLTGTEQWIEIRATPIGALASGQMNPIRLGTDGGVGTVTAHVQLMEGAVSRQSFTQLIPANPGNYTFVLDPATVSAITNSRNLRWRIGGTAT